MRALIIGPDKETAAFASKALIEERFSVDVAKTLKEAAALIKEQPCVLAVMAGDADEIRTLRNDGAECPIMAVSATADPALRARVLDAGADDCIAPPLVKVEFLARVRALLRREKKLTGPVLAAGDISLDTIGRRVTRAGRPVKLGPKEFALLEFFMRNPGVALSRVMILEHAWDMDADLFTNTVDVHVSTLRAKIDKGRRKKMIKAVYGYGYKLEP